MRKYNIKNKVGDKGWLCGQWVKEKGARFYPDLFTKKMEVSYKEFNSKHKGEKHYHKRADEFVLILKGKITEEIDGRTVKLRKGDFILIKSGYKSQLKKAADGTIAIVIKAPGVLKDKYIC